MNAPPTDPFLEFDAYADGIADAAVALRNNSARAGLDTAVPTCPGWQVRDLVAHIGMVHRWATAKVLHERVDPAALEQEGHASSDLLDWLTAGVADLLRTLDHASPDLEARFFLADAPPPRLAWTRRQCHETTIHAVDAMAAALGRAPSADEVWFTGTLGSDGVDELLTGFLPRESTRFRPPEPARVLFSADDTAAAWTVDFGPDGARTTRGDLGGSATRVHAGTCDLYAGLWNRVESLIEEGAPFLPCWRDQMTISW